jgi:hypothetical protein
MDYCALQIEWLAPVCLPGRLGGAESNRGIFHDDQFRVDGACRRTGRCAADATIQPAAPVATIAPVQEGSQPQVAAPAAPAVEGPPVVTPLPVVQPEVASSIHKGAILWRNIESGMTVAQLRALYPQGKNVTFKDDRTVLSDIPIMEGCDAKVNIMHEGGAVKEIVMRGEGSIAGRCSLKLITALSGKYGEPMDKDKVRGSFFAREGKNYIWMRDGVTLQLKRYTNGPLGGGGLFAASWELRYSASTSNIDL